MAKGRMEIGIPENYEFTTISEAVAMLKQPGYSGEEVVLECVRRYFDYASSSRKYRVNAQEKTKQLKAALSAKGLTVEKLLAMHEAREKEVAEQDDQE